MGSEGIAPDDFSCSRPCCFLPVNSKVSGQRNLNKRVKSSKVKFTLEQVTKAQKGSKDTALLFP
jgi:hypothetical protein